MDRWRLRGTVRAAALCFGLVLAASGCQELVVGEKAAEGEVDYPDDLYAATGVGSDHFWAAGYFGAIVHTADGGRTWHKQASGTQRSIYDISFADEKHGWAVGRRGFIIHSSDGGQTWTRQKSPRHPPRHLFAVHAVSPTTAWAVGDWGSRYVTRDGGETWEDASFLVHEDHPSFPYLSDEDLEKFERGEKVYDDVYLNDVFFLDEQHGWIAAEYGFVFRTEDGGRTWEKGEIRGTVAFDPVPFASGAGDVAREQWDALFEASAVLDEKQYLRVRIEGFLTPGELKETGDTTLADDRCLAVSDFFEGEGISQDRIRCLNPTPFDQESVDMKAFTLTKLSDRAEAVIRVIETPFLFDIKFTDPQHGAMAGLGGVLLQSSDGGRTWVYRESGAKQALYSVAMGRNVALAVGEKGLHRRSPDGGLTWEKLPEGETFQDRFEFFGFMRDLIFSTPDRGWVVGQAGLVLRSSDGGLSWEKMDTMARRPAESTTGE